MWVYYLLLFITSACIMTLELVAGRLAAPYIGVSLYTWTGIIGAVLAGMSLGNILGGWLADRTDPRRLLGLLLMLSGAISTLTVPATSTVLSNIPRGWPPLLSIFLASLILFGTPTFWLAAVSPVVYRIVLRDLARLGGTVGRLSAAGIAGSLAGTYATGFYLIPAVGTRSIVLGVAALLVLLGILAMPWTRGKQAVAVILLLLLPAGLARASYPHLYRSGCLVDSAYYCIRISHAGGDPQGAKLLSLDQLVHAAHDPKQPDQLYYDYEKAMAWIARAWQRPDLKVMFLGGGGYTLPYWFERNLPDATLEVAEIDPAVTRVARKELVPGLQRATVHDMDARLVLLQLPAAQRYDLVYGDAFNDVSVPYHLTTVEFGRLVRQHLEPDGMYVLNVIDQPTGRFLGAYATTMQQVFPHVYILPGDALAAKRRYSTYIIVASNTPIPWADWQARLPPDFPLPVLDLEGDHMVLTDDHAPVDRLLLPLFHLRWQQSR